MLIDRLHGTIERRILVNFRVDPDVLARVLPAPFRPALVGGVGLAGICFIRLSAMRPRPLPACAGLASENAAHRVAVRWTEGGAAREGVFIPRRDSSGVMRAVAGLVAPWEHHAASFEVDERAGHYHVAMASADRQVSARFDGKLASRMPAGSVFGSLAEATRFFREGCRGYSPSADGRLHGVELATTRFPLEPLEVESVASSWFGDPERFPSGSVELDSAFLMRDLEHAWRSCAAPASPCP